MILTQKIRDEVLDSPIVKRLCEEGELHIDNSDYVGWNQCFVKGLFAGALKRQSARGAGPLAFGSAVHKGLELFHASANPIMEDVIKVALIEAEAEGLPACSDEKRNMESLETNLYAYGIDYASRPDKFNTLILDDKLLIEQGFSLPIGTLEFETNDFCPSKIDVYWQGKIDLIVQDPTDNNIWIVDHKTTSVMGEKYADGMLRSNQMLGYSWAVRELTKVLGKPVAGVIINCMAVRKSGTEFRRFKIPYPSWQIDEWHKEVLVGCYDLVEKLIRYLQEDSVLPNRESCVSKYGRCSFFDVCNMHPSMKDRTLFDAEQFKVSTFDPLA